MSDFKKATDADVMNEVRKYIEKPDSLALIERAQSFAKKQHEGQMRKSGEPYMVHLTNVAYILATLRVGPKTIAAGYLHDSIEDTDITKEELTDLFDEEISDLVEAVTKIGALPYKGKNDPEYQAANHRKIFIAMASDIRVILIKLADRLHNMRTLEFQSEAAQKRISAETLDVYAPIAHRLGISAIKNELEDIAFYYLNQEEYYHIAHLVEMKKAERDASVQQLIADISRMLEEQGISFRIFGRSKHLYSIYHKMTDRHKRFDEILDLLAIRIVTKTELNCYEILGYIHAAYKPIPGRLKDYIAVPKTNMYQSLHTSIIDREGRIFEVQIRTEEMDEIAERGVAAHWRYKEGRGYDARKEQKEIEDKLSWFRDFTAFTDETTDESDLAYMQALQKDVFEANVYVMTPKGRVIDLPNGATPLDFAYRIHTEVGHTAVGAIVNDAMVPLNTELHTGDVVRIKTQKGTGPSEDWLSIVKSTQAKNKIKSYLSKLELKEKQNHIEDGEKILRDELIKRGFDPNDYDRKRLENIYGQFGVNNFTDFMYGIYIKSISAGQVCEKLTNVKIGTNEKDVVEKILNRDSKKRPANKKGVSVPGIESMKLSIAQCCLPVYGDEIIGYVTKGEGVKVHRKDCCNVKAANARLIDCVWEEKDANWLYDTDVLVIAHDRNFLLTDLVTVISQCKAPLINVSADVNKETLVATIKLKLQVHDVNQLRNVIANMRKVDQVVNVERNNH